MAPRDDMMDTYRELTAGLHKLGLAVQGLAVTQESHERRLTSLDGVVKDDNNSLQTRCARVEDRLTRIEEALEKASQTASSVGQARIQGRATIIAAWIGASVGIVGTIVALVLALAK